MRVAGIRELPAPFVGGEYSVLPERIGRAGGNHEQRAHASREFGDGESIRSGPTRLLWAGGSASIGIGLMRKNTIIQTLSDFPIALSDFSCRWAKESWKSVVTLYIG